MSNLTAKQERFVKEYLVDLNATQACIRSGYKRNTASETGYENLRKPQIRAEIDRLMKERSERLTITADMVLQQWWDIANANPNEIIHHRLICCRYCYGEDHKYQFTDRDEWQGRQDMEDMRAKKEKRKAEKVSTEGGFGYDNTIRPHPKCPRCKGEGYGDIVINDTRDLGHKEQLLYAGLKFGKQGTEIKMRDQDKALENVARHLGMFQDNVNVTGKLTVQEMTAEERQVRINELLNRQRGNGTPPPS